MQHSPSYSDKDVSKEIIQTLHNIFVSFLYVC